MQISDIKQELNRVESLYQELFTMVDKDALDKEIKDLDQVTYDQAFWDDSDRAQKVIKKLKGLKNKQDKLNGFRSLYEDILVLVDLVSEEESMLEELEESIGSFTKMFDSLSVSLLLNGELDDSDAIVEIHPGAGGTESQDWADMLFRMYKRYGEINGYQFELLDYQNGEEAGIKSVTFMLSGDYAYGYLKAESGVHRLVRISPFDSGGRRHTSFASVTVIPDIDKDIDIEISDTDLKIDTYRSSGAGGQSVNTTDSAVRITHLPTKIVVCVQNERSQIKNRDKAMQILKSKLYQIELEKKQEEISQFRSNNVSNSFGSQIRSYVMHPYSMVKDHRTNIETGNVQKVMDGDIEMFISGYLKTLVKGE
jgi:peptide chain release factor 2